MTLNNLEKDFYYEYQCLSQRAKNILCDLEIDTLIKLKAKLKASSNIINIGLVRNCGVKTEMELEGFLKKFKLNKEDFNSANDNCIEKENHLKKEIVVGNKTEMIFHKEMHGLSVRAMNILGQLNAADIKGFHRNIISNNDQYYFLRAKNCGRKTLSELKIFESKVIELINQDKSSANNYGLFSDLEYCLYESGQNRNTGIDILNNLLGVKQNCIEKTLKEIGDDHSLSSERIRQISVRLQKKINNLVMGLKRNGTGNIEDYFSGDAFFVSDDMVELINTSQKTSFSKGFIVYVFECFDHPLYNFVRTEKRLKDYNGIFVKKHIPFNFKLCIDYLYKILFSRRKKDVIVSLRNLLKDYQNTEQIIEKELISNTLNIIISSLNLEENTVVYTNDSIIFKKNTIKLSYEYLREILNEKKVPMHFEDLFEICKERNIKLTSAYSVHSAMISQSDIFGLKGQGKYGLIEWGGYFGKIGDVAEQKIREKKSPIDRRELEEFLCRELYISQDSISVVLFNYELEDRFKKLNNDKITLKEWL